MFSLIIVTTQVSVYYIFINLYFKLVFKKNLVNAV